MSGVIGSWLDRWLEGVSVATGLTERFPDYLAILVAADGIDTELLSGDTGELVARADAVARELDGAAVPHIVRWQEAYRAFGANPRRTRVSVDALARRAAKDGLPRINTLVDCYNALSVIHHTPFGGEDLERYAGHARLVLSDGTEAFHTIADGRPAVEHPAPGEPVWCDDVGVTCRRWNWRQTNRTAITTSTTAALFIVDSLDAPDHAGPLAAAEELVGLLAPASATLAVRRLPRR